MMIAKINNYKGVIIFYLLLALTIICVAERNKMIDKQKMISTSEISSFKYEI